jgi:hypothetical protein
MSLHLPDPSLDVAVDQLARFEAVSSVPQLVSDCIASRRLSYLVRSLNLLLNHPDYRHRAGSAIERIGFPVH